MTDVTGFGLAGHLTNIADASGCGARIDLAALPLMAGAEALAARGIRSTLWPENRAALAGRIAGETESPRAALLFDPQTAGGLLAAVAPGAADALVATLRAQGHDAARIGAMTDAPPGLTLA
jgi:selenide,water dikinase